jgi:predicted GH43/DUF377 family glycosyl hydrolase
MKIDKSPIRLYASAEAVINKFLYLPGKDREKNVIERIKNFSEAEVHKCLAGVMKDFAARHRDIEGVFLDHFSTISTQFEEDVFSFSDSRKILLGAYFTKEYSIQAAALFNPSIVPHPDQSDLPPGAQRFIMSLRATGEGHISSIVFKTGTVDNLSDIHLEKDSGYFTKLKKNNGAIYNKDFIKSRVVFFQGFEIKTIENLPDHFTAAEAIQHIKNRSSEYESAEAAIKSLEEIFDSNYELQCSSNLSLSEKVIFPTAKAERMGMEDVRFVKFEDADNPCYYGSYTAYNGKHIRSQLIETIDFNDFKIRTLYGAAISDKGMALFPEKVNGKYVMIARQGGEKISIMFSEDLYVWENYQLLMEPKYPWELVQLGNCGSPVKTDQGWLLLTHGVGPMRTYVISAVLLDLADPSKIIGRLDKPLIRADESEKEGYVPNVVYTCGLLRHGDMLIIPYAVSDSATGFVTVELNALLNEMKNQILP